MSAPVSAAGQADARPPGLPRRGLLLGAVVLGALLGCAAPAGAQDRWIDLQVVDRDEGRLLPQHRHRGRTYLAAAEGQRYALQLRNLSGERLLVVLSVDGLNVVTGETAGFGQSGYVLGPWQRLEVAGWRKNLDEVAGFEFSALGQSYAARTGRPFDVGVIGAAVFRERRATVGVAPIAPRESDTPDVPPPVRALPQASKAPATGDAMNARTEAAGASQARSAEAVSAAPARRERLGTAHGERETAPARHVAFERDATQPADVVALHYDSRANLVALGVLPRVQPRPWPQPTPFPAQPRSLGYVPDPPPQRPW